MEAGVRRGMAGTENCAAPREVPPFISTLVRRVGTPAESNQPVSRAGRCVTRRARGNAPGAPGVRRDCAEAIALSPIQPALPRPRVLLDRTYR